MITSGEERIAAVQSQPIVRLAMLGMVAGNGHPYSWSSIINGYDAEAMAACPYPAIQTYLALAPKEQCGFGCARVTHIWTDNLEDAHKVARTAHIPFVVNRPKDVIGHVDAVIIATDRGDQHAERCRPFVEEGLPIFVDKPLVEDAGDLRLFCDWIDAGARIMSCSCMRYAKEFLPYRASTADLGAIRFATITTPKNWEQYAIHALESIYCVLGSGFVSARWMGSAGRNFVLYKHRSGADVLVAVVEDMYGAFCSLSLFGTAGQAHASFSDTFFAFRAQLLDFVEYVRTGVVRFLFEETVELMKMLIAGIQSRNDGGREVQLDRILPTAWE